MIRLPTRNKPRNITPAHNDWTACVAGQWLNIGSHLQA
ncbi:hypothetical protein BLL52_0759 [Rhodoferax antarcticus ANT.BR]|uniref:Uncharacterized protein n=1 Tax=Rhodoferax antarcticus ANT.BR TaxID=1111071 RepID=A0A1Q8YI92_9BURK|nr:hypothetical protein BLL52_0759 [Rhodoferax antarcticus ANT.BR]